MKIILILLIPLCFSFNLSAQQNCNNWLSLPSRPSYMTVGDLDIPGNKLTVEALFNRTTSYSGGRLYAGDLVTKHDGPSDVNYLLRPNNAEITTTNGYFATPPTCEIDLNKTYHVAMVYDGSTLKFYRNGFLMSQIAASGNLVQNNWQTKIGFYDPQVHSTNFIGFINEVKIWNVPRTQAEIRSSMMTIPFSSPTTQNGLLAYYSFNDLINKQGNSTWNGTLGGTATINAMNSNCILIVDSCNIITKTFDFSYKQNACDPLSIQFTDYDNETKENYWSFGDGITVTDQPNPAHQYALPGTYTVKYVLRNVAADTVIKNIQFNVEEGDIILTQDTTICYGNTLQLLTKPSINFCWDPVDFLDDPSSSNPTSSATEPIDYRYTASIEGNNLVSNGNFSAGNTAFSSDYQFNNNYTSSNQYTIGTSSFGWNNQLNNCLDHSSGSGNMMIVQGSVEKNKIIWTQQVQIQPHTNYSFNAWLQTLSSKNNIDLLMKIDDHTLEIIDETLTPCNWKRIAGTWNSGNKTFVVLSVINRNNQMQVSDFALDDISFSPIKIMEETVSVKIDKPILLVSDEQTVCTGSTVEISASGAQTYSWSPANLFDDPTVGNAFATVYESTNLFVTGTTENGCLIKDSVAIKILPIPTITKTNDTEICANSSIQLMVNGGETYSWTPQASLDNASVPNPIASPLSDTKYFVSITDQNDCEHIDSIQINIKPVPDFSIAPSSGICEDEPVFLWAKGGDTYSWTPSNLLDNSGIPDPTALIDQQTVFKVLITESECNQSVELSTTINVFSKPQINASSSNDIDCSTSFSQLVATGGLSYEWLPATGLDFADKANPIAKPVVTTNYIVTAKDQNGCIASDSVTIVVNFTGTANNYIYNAFTPNNDGLNDCFGIKHWGNVEALNFSIYNRWGQKIFNTDNSNVCWNGTFKGSPQEPGTYIYQITGKTVCEDVNLKGTFMLIR